MPKKPSAFKGRRVFIVGVGLTALCVRPAGARVPLIDCSEKPRQRRDYDEMAVEAATKALLDAGINYDAVEQARCRTRDIPKPDICAGLRRLLLRRQVRAVLLFATCLISCSTCGQRALYALGMTGIPITKCVSRSADRGEGVDTSPASSASS